MISFPAAQGICVARRTPAGLGRGPRGNRAEKITRLTATAVAVALVSNPWQTSLNYSIKYRYGNGSQSQAFADVRLSWSR